MTLENLVKNLIGAVYIGDNSEETETAGVFGMEPMYFTIMGI